MTKSDVGKLFSLLRELYPRQPQPETAERSLAWFLALEPYKYEAVRAAALMHARRSDYYPSVSEIAEGLPVQEMQEKKPRGEHAWMAQYMTPEYEARFGRPPNVSKYAREHGVTWREAAAALEKEAKKRMEETE